VVVLAEVVLVEISQVVAVAVVGLCNQQFI
jgi:hypothetical protein